MKFFILVCLASAVFATEEEAVADRDIDKAKQALAQLTFSKEEHIYDIGGYVEKDNDEGGYANDVKNPCLEIECGLGRECMVDRINDEPFCDCARSCPFPDESDDEIHRIHVCTTNNVSYPNQCEFRRQKCLNPEAMSEVHIDYNGECTVIPPCLLEDLAEYPKRMTQWFIESLQYLLERPEEHGGVTEKEKQALKEPRKQEAKAIFWRFRRLDRNPADLYLDFAELEPLRAPISLMEPCTQPFLTACDVNDDSLISVLEFGRCLNLDERDMEY